MAALAAKLALDIETEPAMLVKIDGEKVGTGVVHASLPPGRHRIEASDKALRVYSVREVDLRGDHQSVKIEVSKAQLAFDVPAGATVTVDGKAIGTAPVEPVELYAGTHEAVVEFNGARTVQRVPISDFNVTLTVHPN
jgi:serine/threonine-protein kinase